VLVLAFSGLFGTWYAYKEGAGALEQAGVLGRLIDGARSAQVDFKTQVQLWKNLLLRGQDVAEFQKYLGRFQRQQELVQKDLQALSLAPGLPESLKSEVEGTMADHRKLTESYADALQHYVSGNPASIFVVDEKVRGIDQQLNERIDEIASKLAEGEKLQLAELRTQGEKRYEMLRLVSLIFSGVAAVMAVVLGLRAINHRPA
jgi:methyl-accepting chemotaxis protein